MTRAADPCDLCGRQELEAIYRPPSTGRGLTVHVCRACGLVQSLPRIDHVPQRTVAVSGGAGWGNVRYGKGFQTPRAVSLLSRLVDWKALRSCLDVGSNRGSFVTRLHELAPQAEIIAIEPDARIVDAYRGLSRVDLRVDRVENVELSAKRFDLIYCSHTLEHIGSPRELLTRLRTALAPGGKLYLEVPNLEFIRTQNVVEEWFLDKHLYHFSAPVLAKYLSLAGLTICEGFSEVDAENITMIAQAGAEAGRVSRDEALAEAGAEMTLRYAETLRRNQTALGAVARRIEEMARGGRLVVWGAGRIFDSLVVHGGLDVSLLKGLVDKHLSSLVGEVHGVRVLAPAKLPSLAPDVVVIASRSFAEDISEEAGVLMPQAQCVVFSDLWSSMGAVT